MCLSTSWILRLLKVCAMTPGSQSLHFKRYNIVTYSNDNVKIISNRVILYIKHSQNSKLSPLGGKESSGNHTVILGTVNASLCTVPQRHLLWEHHLFSLLSCHLYSVSYHTFCSKLFSQSWNSDIAISLVICSHKQGIDFWQGMDSVRKQEEAATSVVL